MQKKASTKKDQLALSTPEGIVPKPTKAQIIEATFLRAKQLHAEKVTKYEAKRKALLEEWDAEVRALIAAGKFSIRNIGEITEAGAFPKLFLQSPKLKALCKKDDALHESKPPYFDDKEVLKQIRARFNGPQASTAELLSNPEFTQRADAFLADTGLA